MSASGNARRDPYYGPVHKTVLLTPPFPIDLFTTDADGQVEIDTEIAPLIQACWAMGLETAACCQGRRDIKRWSNTKYAAAYILFRGSASRRSSAVSLHHAAEFVRLADRAGVGPHRHWTQWRFYFDPRPPYSHSVSFPPAYIEAIAAELEQSIS